MFNHSNHIENNGSSGYYKYFSCRETFMQINCYLNFPLIIISVVGNISVLLAIFSTPSLRSSASLIFICSLAVSDLLVGIVVQPVYIASGFVRNQFLDSTSFLLSFATCGISLLSITAVSVDRCLALHYHMRYQLIVTSYRAKLVIAVLWLAIFLLSGVYCWSSLAYFLLIAVGVIFCLIISVLSYTRIYTIVRTQRKKIRVQQRAINIQTPNASNMTVLKKSALSSFVFFAVMVLFYLPMGIAMCLLLHTTKWRPEWSFATTAVFMNSSVSPFLYCWRLKELRRAVARLIPRFICKNN